MPLNIGFPCDKTVFLNKLSRGKTNEGKTTYSVRDYFVYAALEPEKYSEPEHLAALIKEAILSEKKRENEVNR